MTNSELPHFCQRLFPRRATLRLEQRFAPPSQSVLAFREALTRVPWQSIVESRVLLMATSSLN
jgi:hypothetical protein